MAGNTEKPSMGEFSCSSVVRCLLHGSPQQVFNERESMVLNCLLVVHGGKWMYKTILTSQSRPEINYLLQGGMSE